jgi:HAD superfamily hydrolase (TIGR01509 family)
MKAHRRECELVIFDCDGVLVDSELLSARAYAELLAELGVAAPEGVLQGCIGLKQADIFARVEAAAGRAIAPADRALLWPRTRALFAAELTPTPRLVPFLDRLRLARCVASSSFDERIRFSLEATGLRGYFGDAIFSAYSVAHGKPAPDIFLHAAKAMGAHPERCVVIEDSVPGVEGAVAAGMTAIGFLGGMHVEPGHAERLTGAGASLAAASWNDVERWLASDGRRATSGVSSRTRI